VHFDGVDVTGVPVRKRNVAMVYQQFVNYPALSVYENIASPLRVAGRPETEIDKAVREAAALLKLEPYLDRLPLNLSGGQQQRTAIARALVKGAGLVLLDEPLANLDYKLREELRAELPKVFAKSGAIFVYATTEPSEALLLGGNTATLREGRVTQFGPTVDVYRHPVDIETARTFADPPLNTAKAKKAGNRLILASGGEISVPAHLANAPDGTCTIGFQPHHLAFAGKTAKRDCLDARVLVTEITGSESFVHLGRGDDRWILLTEGVRGYEPETDVRVLLDTRHLLAFDASGQALVSGKAG
jgi:glycerol transport system ATP-binding protein